ncbi:putative ABC transporter, ATP-binding protein [Trichinella spiralis]|uniref:putative ABC transporter, ATP-binding protein n=1 Tax=Trichinella spiralis TaxID=6334 RepID=UPI0001EFB91C|nr:putative ABC transporter, ATP-binding protein [Trichinella spiralis]
MGSDLFSSGSATGVDQAGCFSFITYSWIFKYLWATFRGKDPNHVQPWACSVYDSANVNIARLEYLWKVESEKTTKPSLSRSLYQFIRMRFFFACLCFFFCLIFGFIGPTCLVRALIQFTQTRWEEAPIGYGIFLAFAMLVVELCRVLSYGATWAISTRTALRARGAVLGFLFKRLMFQRETNEDSIGEIMNIFANDSQRIFDAVSFLPLVVVSPLVLLGDIRRDEKKALFKTAVAQSLALGLGSVMPVVAATSTFVIYLSLGYDLLPDQAYAVITVFFVMVFSIRMIPYGMRYLAEAKVSLEKIQVHLMEPELLPVRNLHVTSSVALEIRDGHFLWNVVEPPDDAKETLLRDNGPSTKQFALTDINIKIYKMVQGNGEMQVGGSVAYCSQDPWILNATVRENILLGETLNVQLYNTVLRVCNLEADIETFPAGDRTEVCTAFWCTCLFVGERGATLSGGQKARLSLARAIYHQKDIYLLDNVLTALDYNVASRVLKEAIQEHLSGKTVLLITSCVQRYRFDEIVKSEQSCDARIQDQDQYVKEIIANVPVKYDKLFESEENLQQRGLSMNTYKSYFEAMGSFRMVLLVLALFAFSTGSTIFSTFWLSYWLKKIHPEFGSSSSSHSAEQNSTSVVSPETMNSFAIVYGLTVPLVILTTVLKAYVFVGVTLRASEHLHNTMFKRLMHGTMRWFDITPVGRVINRFSKDIDETDTKIPFTLDTMLQNLCFIFAYLIIIAWVFPWFLIAAVPLAGIFILFIGCFRGGIRSLKRIENNTRSPLFSHISASVRGKSVLRPFGKTKVFVERLMIYYYYLFNIEQEQLSACQSTLDACWLTEGAVSFKNVSLRYGEDKQLALKNVSFDAAGGEKIGIIGRTGSGKSSLVSALLRLYPICEGTICIDSHDVTLLDLRQLRCKIGVIPQDPVLFSGTLRFNVDPQGKCSDMQLWKAIETVQLKHVVEQKMGNGLDTRIEQGGRNFSVGERQLICMARAFLQNVSIFLLDEATAHLDSATDHSVQRCFDDVAKKCTVFIIAHRLNSVMACDKILYLEDGQCCSSSLITARHWLIDCMKSSNACCLNSVLFNVKLALVAALILRRSNSYESSIYQKSIIIPIIVNYIYLPYYYVLIVLLCNGEKMCKFFSCLLIVF